MTGLPLFKLVNKHEALVLFDDKLTISYIYILIEPCAGNWMSVVIVKVQLAFAAITTSEDDYTVNNMVYWAV